VYILYSHQELMSICHIMSSMSKYRWYMMYLLVFVISSFVISLKKSRKTNWSRISIHMGCLLHSQSTETSSVKRWILQELDGYCSTDLEYRSDSISPTEVWKCKDEEKVALLPIIMRRHGRHGFQRFIYVCLFFAPNGSE
jgi:hypothetical protein